MNHPNVRVIVHIILSACVKTSVESVAETLVSRYENHFTSSRQLTEENALDEMVIAENDNLLERAMNKYWVQNSENGKWHFIRECNNISSYLGGSSKVLGRAIETSICCRKKQN